MNLYSRLLTISFAVLIFISCGEERQQPSFQFSLNNPAESGSQYPNLYRDSSGTITMSWLSGIEEDIYAIEYTMYDGDRWTDTETVGLSQDYFVNWADIPSVVSRNGEVVAAHWLKKIEGGPYAYNVNIVFPEEQARQWTDPVTPHRDETATEHGFVSMEPLTSDRVLAIWLDGRQTAGRDHDEYEDPEKAMTLRSAEISKDGAVTRGQEIDAMVCDCCSTDMIMQNGNALAVYRDRTEEEIRDISIVRYDTARGAWSTPVPVSEDGWQISGCPVNGPRIDANGDQVAVAWYTGADDQPAVNVARSVDGGMTFGDPVVVAREHTLGRTDLVVGDDGTLYVSWLSGIEEKGYVMVRSVSPAGDLGEPVRVGITTSNRLSGFPRIAATDNGIFFAWTQTDPLIRVRTALVPYDDLSGNREN
ncbi:MAG: hypothetical protein GVY07_04300 [Bacteroidetes bacterium]|jgi:hypothetical protein|nr:hypothetical protein [Bacteroidota bacterium]